MEASKPTPFVPPLQSWEIIKRALAITFVHGWVMIFAKFAIDIPCFAAQSFLPSLESGFNFTSFYALLIGGFALIAIYRSILLLETQGTTPSLAGLFGIGAQYYWRHVMVSFLAGGFLLAVALGAFALIAPALLLDPKHPAAPWVRIIGGLAAVALVFWWIMRSAFVKAALVDDAKGAADAMAKTLALTKGNALTLLPPTILLGLCWSANTAFLVITHDAMVERFPSLSGAPLAFVDVLLFAPTSCLEVFTTATIVLSYLHFKKYAAPALAVDEPKQ